MSDPGEQVMDVPPAFWPLLEPARYKGAYGGRGSGKSHFFAQLLVARMVRERIDVVCVREVQRTLDQSVKKLIESKIEAMGVADRFLVQDRRIRSAMGGQIIFEGMQNHTADSIKSLEGYGVAWVEEAQTLSQRSLDLLRPTIRAEGSELWFGWNPEHATDPVDVLLRGPVPPPGAVVCQVNWRDNPWFPEVLRSEMLYDRGRDLDKYNHIWLGEYQQHSEARVFRNWRVAEFEAPAEAEHRLGADWGFASDPSVLIRCHLDGLLLRVDFEAYQVGCEIDNLPMLFDSVPDARQWSITADSARPETISYMRRHGYPRINAAAKGAGSVEDGIEWLKSFEIVVHPRCKHLIDELSLYRYKTDSLTGLVLPVLEDKDNHVIDALRYACEGARKAQQSAERTRRKPPEPRRTVHQGQGGGWMGA